MKLKIVLSIFLALLPISMWSQVKATKNFDYSVSKPYKVVDARDKFYLTEGNMLLLVKTQDKKIIFQKFSTESLDLIAYKEYTDMGDDYDIESLEKIDNSYYLFYSIWDKPNEKEQLFVRVIDFENCSFSSEGARIIAVEGRITGIPTMMVNFWSVGAQDKFNIELSNDKSRVLVHFRMKPEIKNDDKNFDVIGLYVFDNNMTRLWGKEIKMPYTEARMNNYDYSVNRNGDAYVLATVLNDEGAETSNENSDYHIEILRYKAMTGEMSTVKAGTNYKFINDMGIFEGPGDNIFCAGYYANGKSDYSADGQLLLTYNQESNEVSATTCEIPVEIINQFEKRRTEKKNNKAEAKDKAEMPCMMINNMLINDDESTILIGEQYYVQAHTTYINNTVQTYYTYHYDDVLISKVDKDGKLLWMKKLPKQQVGRNGLGGMSYKHFFSDNYHYILYLDNVKNIDLPFDEQPAAHADGAGGFLTAYRISDATGEVEKLSLFDITDVNGIELFQFKPNRIVQVSPKDFIIEAYKKNKEDVLVKLHLND